MTLSVWMLGLMALGCGDSETPPCADGFVKKQGRWCVFDEAALGLTDGEPDPADLPEGEGGAGSGGGETSEDEVDEYVFDPEEPEVSLDLTEIEWAMEEAIRTVRWIDPGKMHDAYDQVEADGDENCPDYDEEYYDENQRYHWRDACSVGSGGSFAGYAYSNYYGEYRTENEAYDYAGHAYFNGSARIEDSRGNTFIGGGSSSYYERHRTTTGDGTFYQSMTGNFRFDDPNYFGTWLSEDMNISLYHTSTMYVDDADHFGGGFSVFWNASVSGIVGQINSLRLSNIYMYSENTGSMCELEPSGSIAVRDNDGNWYEAEFDGPKYFDAGAFPPDCDGCGKVYWRGELLGEVCPDFGLLVNWEDRPWL